MNESFGSGAGVMEEEMTPEEAREEAREEIRSLVGEAKEHIEDWKKGEGEGYYPHVEKLDPDTISDEDLDFWNQIKGGDVTPEDFYNRYDRPKEGEPRNDNDEIKETRAAFRALASHMLDKYSLEKAEKQEVEPEKF